MGEEYFHLGRDMPRLAIYVDGQVIIQSGDWGESRVLEAYLSATEVCELLANIEQAGFFNDIDPIYTVDENSLGDGAPVYIIQVNGQLNKQEEIYLRGLEYTVQEISAAYQLVSNYYPVGALRAYQPAKVLLWIGEFSQDEVSPSLVQEYPPELPPITELMKSRGEFGVLTEGQLARDFWELADYRLKFMYFRVDGDLYGIIAWPILPHETSQSIAPFPHGSVDVGPRINCDGTPAFSSG